MLMTLVDNKYSNILRAHVCLIIWNWPIGQSGISITCSTHIGYLSKETDDDELEESSEDVLVAL